MCICVVFIFFNINVIPGQGCSGIIEKEKFLSCQSIQKYLTQNLLPILTETEQIHHIQLSLDQQNFV